MINFRIIARTFSLLLIFEGLFMLLCAGVSYIYNEPAMYSFLYSALITFLTGVLAITPVKDEERVTGKKEGYIIVTGIWVLFSLFGALPYLFSKSLPNFTEAFFESISGFTTTSATVFSDVEKLEHGILFWRSLTQWLGGIGVIFISLYVLPVFKSVYIQLPSGDFSGQSGDKIHPRIRDAAKRLIIIYLLITISEFILLIIAGMPVFDSICHSFSTLSAGGFSTRNAGIDAFTGPLVKAVITIFMFIAGVNMTFFYFSLKRNFRKVFANNEFLFYTVVTAVFVLVISLVLYFNGFGPFKAILDGAFQVVSIISTTGYFLTDTRIWIDIILIILFILMFSGGTAGSNGGGLKMVRLLLVTRNAGKELERLVHPNAYIPVRLDKKIVPETTLYNLLVFITLYFLIVCGSAFLISFTGYGIIESFSTAATMLANIGPHLTESGLTADYSAMPAAGKWFLSVLMISGRLELLTVIVLFTRSFYRD